MKGALFCISALFSLSVMAIPIKGAPPTLIAQPTSCIASQFSATGDQWWKEVTLKLSNACGKPVDFQSSTITFKSRTAINAAFWGNFSPLSYPDNNLNITSQPQSDGTHLATMNLHFPSYVGANSVLPAGSSIQIIYGVDKDNHVEGSTNVYLQSNPQTGTLRLNNNTAKPANVTQDYALVHVTMNNQRISDVQLGWNKSIDLTGLSTGTYVITPESLLDNTGNTYQGTAIPNSVQLTENQTVTANITYTLVQNNGKINIRVQPLPPELTGYTANPSVLITQTSTGSSISKSVTWNTVTTVSSLKTGSSYSFSTANINFNNHVCSPTFTPATAVAGEATVPEVKLTYQCVQVAQAQVTFNVSGAPTGLTSLTLTLTPNNGTAPINRVVTLNNGTGSSVIGLVQGVIYTISADPVPGYSISFSPQPLTATNNAVETIQLIKLPETTGRLITYVPGWKTPPSAQALATAGYTHVLVAFGVFSTSTPGNIVSAFDTVTKEYIQSLHSVGIKVILSLGGALTSIPNTSVDFHQVLSSASSPSVFQQTFINSLNGLMTQYGFDGFDIDIEHGLNGGGTFAQPQGDIAVLANIINTMHAQKPELLITLAPQVANVSATSGFDATWGNYASLTMQTYASLTWVGVQVYNTGCAYGIDLICYGDSPSSPDLSVAMAAGLLENWPSMVGGRATGFQPYISHLRPDQVVLGYPAPNASGHSDGAPVKSTAVIKRAFQCLKTAVKGATSCDTYVPPRAYGLIGGVFNWEATYDQNNNFKFATDLKNCVINGNCN